MEKGVSSKCNTRSTALNEKGGIEACDHVCWVWDGGGPQGIWFGRPGEKGGKTGGRKKGISHSLSGFGGDEK